MRRDPFLVCCGFLHIWLLAAGMYLTMLSFMLPISFEKILKSLILAVPVTVLWAAAQYGKKIWSYILAAGVCMTGAWAAGGVPWDRGCLMAAVGLLVILYFAERLSGYPQVPSVPAYPYLFFFAAFYGCSIYYHHDLLKKFAVVGAGIYWLVILWRKNRIEFLDYYQENQTLHRFPGKRIAAGTQLALLLFSVFTVTGMLFFPVSGADQVILAIGRLLRRILGLLFKGLEQEPEPVVSQAEEMPAQMEFPLTESVMPAFWTKILQILDKIVEIAFLAALAAGACYLLYKIYKTYNMSRSDNQDVLEAIPAAQTEIKERIKDRKSRIPWMEKRTVKARIRKYYRNQILKRTQGVPHACRTPEELEKQAGLVKGEVTEEFHELYEKARYGKQECTAADAARMKQLDRLDFS